MRGNFLKIKKIKNLVEKQINDGVIGKDDGECQGWQWVEMGGIMVDVGGTKKDFKYIQVLW